MIGYSRGKTREGRVGVSRSLKGQFGGLPKPQGCCTESPAGPQELTGAGEIAVVGEYQTIVLKLYCVGPA